MCQCFTPSASRLADPWGRGTEQKKKKKGMLLCVCHRISAHRWLRIKPMKGQSGRYRAHGAVILIVEFTTPIINDQIEI